jgi:hypothetical protein
MSEAADQEHWRSVRTAGRSARVMGLPVTEVMGISGAGEGSQLPDEKLRRTLDARWPAALWLRLAVGIGGPRR